MDLATVRNHRRKEPRVSPRPEAIKLLTESYRKILDTLGLMGYPTKTDDNFADTAARAAKALTELIRPVAEIENEIDAMIERTFPARYDEMVISKHNICFGVCPHHLLPVIYRISVAYLPGERVIGISKLSRLVQLLSRRPVLQEDLTHELAEILHERLEARGSAAYVEGLHLCMASRGIEAHEARVVTSAVRGVFRDQPATRQEFLDLVTAPQMNLL
jgi:GTP cyclohydrolase IA